MFEGIPTPSFLEGNPYFSAGFGLGILGTGLAALRGGAKAAMTMAQRHFLVTLEVTSKDKAYPWVLQWLNKHAEASKSTIGQHITVDTITSDLESKSTADVATWLNVDVANVININADIDFDIDVDVQVLCSHM